MAQTGTGSDIVLLVPSPSSVPVGTPVTLTATVAPSSSGGATPTGTVQFLFGGSYVLGTATLSSGSGSSSVPTSALSPGNYNVTASYSGDANYAATTSPAVPVVLQKYTTSTVLSVPSAPVAEGSHALITATVTDTQGSVVPTGTVALVYGNSVLAEIPLVNGVATLEAPTSGIAGGTYALTAVYNGDSSNATSTSSSQTVTVAGATTTTVAFGTTQYASGQTATLTATVAGVNGGGTPTGSVQFSVGSIALGGAPLVSGVATLTVPTAGIPQSSYPITASYGGATTFLPSSGTASITVGPAYAVMPAQAVVGLSGSTQFAVSPAANGAVTWYVNGIAGGNSTVGTIDGNGNYSAPATGTTYLTAAVTASVASEPTYVSPAASAYVIAPGTVSTTTNPYVAEYTISLPQGASVAVNFGQSTSYGLNTSYVTAPTGGGATTVQVAGMIGGDQYHLQGTVSLPGALRFTDSDNTFTPAGLGSSDFPTISVVTNTSPQPGIEIADNITYQPVPVFAFDLDGNPIWAYQEPDFTPGDIVQPIRQLPNGHFLLAVGQSSTAPLGAGVPNGALQVIREIDLVGNTIQELSLATLNANVTAAGFGSLDLLTLHHEILVLPTGHWIVLSNRLVSESGLTGYNSPVNVLGDVLVDVDPNNNFAVGWVWSEFDHINLNRHPYMFPDWTHTNAVVYSVDDGNLLVSMRHQNQVVKVNYANGTGDGTILWHLGAADPAVGETADFQLEYANGTPDTDADDWQYAQHLPAFVSANTTGVFELALMDNGTDRGVYTAGICGGQSTAPCYTRAPIFTIDESAMTATLTFADQLSTTYYSFFAGDTEPQANGDLEYDLASYVNNVSNNSSSIQETSTGAGPQVVWQTNVYGEELYRAFRVGSFYPGITWPLGAGVPESAREKHRLHGREEIARRAPMGKTPQM